MIYETYNPDKDPFFNDICVNNELTKEALTVYADTFLDTRKQNTKQSELLLRRAFHSCWLTQHNKVSSAMTIRMLLLCVPYITQEMLSWLGLFSEKSCKNYLSKQIYSSENKQGKMRTFNLQGSYCNKKAYTLTAMARQELLSQLPEEYKSKHLTTSDRSCYSSNTHDALCCNIYYYLLADMHFPYFVWHNVPFFDKKKTFQESLDNNIRIPESGTTGFRPDALIRTLERNERYLFVEMDTGTESNQRISEKIDNYVTFYTDNAKGIEALSTILFSLYIDCNEPGYPRIASKIGKIRKNTAASMKRACNELLMYIDTLTNECETKLNTKELLSKLQQRKKTNHKHHKMIDNHMTDMYEILKNFHEKYPEEEDITSLITYLDELVTERGLDANKHTASMEDNMFLARKARLKKIIENNTELQHLMTKGLRFVVTKYNYPHEINNVLLTHHTEDVLEKKLLPSVAEVLDLSGNSVISHGISLGGGIYFHNHCVYEDNPELNIVFENISSDLSAWYRLKNFVSRFSKLPAERLCIVILASSMEDIIKLNSEIYGDGLTLSSVYCSKKNCKVPANNIQLIYYCYSTDKEFKQPFVLNDDSEKVYL